MWGEKVREEEDSSPLIEEGTANGGILDSPDNFTTTDLITREGGREGESNEDYTPLWLPQQLTQVQWQCLRYLPQQSSAHLRACAETPAQQ